MRTSFRAGWRLPMLAMLLVVLGMRTWADNQPPIETGLDGIKLNSTFNEVLMLKGAPTFIGPAVQSLDRLVTLLEVPPVTASITVPGAFGAPRPGMPSMISGSSMPATTASTTRIEKII